MHQSSICPSDSLRWLIKALTGAFLPNKLAGMSARSCITSQVHEAFLRAIPPTPQQGIDSKFFSGAGRQQISAPRVLFDTGPVEVELTRTRTNTNPNGTEANAAGRDGNARALRKQSKCGMIQEGEGHWPNSSQNLQKARNLWVLRTPQNNKEEGARAKKLVTCGTRGPLGRGQSVPFSAPGAYCSAPEP